MKIHKMTASFGALQNQTLELSDGLNIITAPNEGGKSTWCSFIKSMLYGIDSSAREKAGIKPDKVKFAPWSGAPMCGTMDIEFCGNQITLSRQGREGAPMRVFSANYTNTAESAEIPQSLVGETLLGVPREVFERSAFIAQGSVAVGQSPELEKRIAAIVQTGDQGCSATEAGETLRAAMRRRRHNKSGRLPEIETEIAAIRGTLMEIDRLKLQGVELASAKQQALTRRDALTEKVAEGRRAQRRSSLDELSSYRNALRALESAHEDKSRLAIAAETKLKSGHFGMTEPELCRQSVLEAEAHLNKLSAAACKGGSTAANIALILIFAAITVGLALAVEFNLFFLASKLISLIPSIITGLIALSLTVRLFLLRKKRNASSLESLSVLGKFGCTSMEELAELLSLHIFSYEQYLTAVADRDDAAATADAAKSALELHDLKMLEQLDFVSGDGELAHDNRRLAEAESALRQIREEIAKNEGRKSALDNDESLSEKLSALLAEHHKLSIEYDALSEAVETLAQSAAEIQKRIAPKLASQTAEYFSKLTGERYDALTLDRQLNASVRLNGDAISHEASFLSTGTLDQLYLAVRLAICELALPAELPCPIILDDALVNFDDNRCKKALDVILEFSKKHQVILFTCHDREARFLGNCEHMRVLSI